MLRIHKREDGTGNEAWVVHFGERSCVYGSWQGGVGQHLCMYSVGTTKKKHTQAQLAPNGQ